MKLARHLRKLHKWIFLVIGLQALLWTASGFYMVVMNLDFIHGDHLVKNLREPLPDFSQPLYPTAQIVEAGQAVKSVQLKVLQGRPYFLVRDSHGEYRRDAYSGALIDTVDARGAADLARHYYAGEGKVARVQLISSDPPTEIPARILPVWRVDFDDRFGTTLYIDPGTAALVTRRHDLWRAFDFFWMLHIMDYEERADVTNPLLRILIVASLMGALAGVALLPFSFRLLRNRKKGRVRRSGNKTRAANARRRATA
ncbi:hypothetical protein [Microbulbifer guangxiensis]|uniref:hypothetical protein n=1 Tax=Microbulbifer guangxiensis TaxID=2904249 RepID=UPI001F28BDA0|nr:hypothetical protein [Microbulbifer guangxiensis]